MRIKARRKEIGSACARAVSACHKVRSFTRIVSSNHFDEADPVILYDPLLEALVKADASGAAQRAHTPEEPPLPQPTSMITFRRDRSLRSAVARSSSSNDTNLCENPGRNRSSAYSEPALIEGRIENVSAVTDTSNHRSDRSPISFADAHPRGFITQHRQPVDQDRAQ